MLYIGIGTVGDEVFRSSGLYVQKGNSITALEFRSLLAINKVDGSFRIRHHYHRREAKWIAQAINAKFGINIALPVDWSGPRFPDLCLGDVVVGITYRPPEANVSARY